MNSKQTETSRTFRVDHVTLNRETHNVVTELTSIDDIVMAALDNDDECAQCGLPITESRQQRTDLLCDYCGGDA